MADKEINCLVADDEFEPSKLGSQDFWKEYFARDLANYNDHLDCGEIWFGYESIKRVINWILERNDFPKNSKIIDLCCGNGMMLVELAKEGFTQLTGVDYVDEALQLASLISSQNHLSQYITFEVGDLVNQECRGNALNSTYDLVLDKGVFDAICLSDKKENKLAYISNVCKLCRDDSIFIITSCNWTLDELNLHYAKYFELIDTIPSSTFCFGGKKGNRETIAVYKKISNIS